MVDGDHSRYAKIACKEGRKCSKGEAQKVTNNNFFGFYRSTKYSSRVERIFSDQIYPLIKNMSLSTRDVF